MPPRLSKRQQRGLEELEALNGLELPKDEVVTSEDEEPAVGLSARSGAGFAALGMVDDNASESEEESRPQARQSKAKKKKKKKGSGVATPSGPPAPPRAVEVKSPEPTPTPPGGPSKREKKAAKRAKAKEKKEGKDDLSKALDELAVKYPELQNVAASTSKTVTPPSSSHSLFSLLSVSLPHLDSEAEMRKFFGSKVISATKDSSTPSTSRARTKGGIQRSNLTRPQPTWWAAKQREGLTLRPISPDELEKKMNTFGWVQVPGEMWWTVEYSKRYKAMTMAFMQAVMSGDPEQFWSLLGKLPWHADTLLQLSELYRYREEHSQAMDFIDRALFTYERAFIGSFNLTSGINRLDFDHVENRPFYLAVHRQVADLQRRGCFRTSFEFARLLCSLDPSSDPHGAFLHLDFLAIKAGMHDWLLDVWNFYQAEADSPSSPYKGRINASALPGWAYARALALRIKEDKEGDKTHQASTSALREAILAFPSVVPLLADKADLLIAGEVRSHRAFRIHTESQTLLTTSDAILHLLSHLYAQRSSPVWKKQAYSSWLSSTALAALPDLPQTPITNPRLALFHGLFGKPSLQYSVYRHVIVLESQLRNLEPFIRRDVRETLTRLACDPVPPPTRVNDYNETFFASVDMSMLGVNVGSRRAQERMLERLLPDPVFRQQLQGFFDAHPQIAERFPGGILQFAQIAGQLPPDVLDDIMMMGAMEDEDGEDRMPGDLRHEIIYADFTDEEDEGEQEQEQEEQEREQEREQEQEQEQGEGLRVNQQARRPSQFVPGALPTQAEDEDEDEDEEDGEEDTEQATHTMGFLRNLLGRFWGAAPAPQYDYDDSEDSEDEPEPRAHDDDVD